LRLLEKIRKKETRRTLREILLSEEEHTEDEDRLTTIALKLKTKKRLSRFIPKGLTYDEGIQRILDLLEEAVEKR